MLHRHGITRDHQYEPPGFHQAILIYPLASSVNRLLKPQEYIGIRPQDLNKFTFSDLRHQSEKLLMHPVFTYQDPGGYALRQHLRALDNNILLSQLSPTHGVAEKEGFCSAQQLRTWYQRFPELIRNTEKLLQEASFTFDFTSRKNNFYFTTSAYAD